MRHTKIVGRMAQRNILFIAQALVIGERKSAVARWRRRRSQYLNFYP